MIHSIFSWFRIRCNSFCMRIVDTFSLTYPKIQEFLYPYELNNDGRTRPGVTLELVSSGLCFGYDPIHRVLSMLIRESSRHIDVFTFGVSTVSIRITMIVLEQTFISVFTNDVVGG